MLKAHVCHFILRTISASIQLVIFFRSPKLNLKLNFKKWNRFEWNVEENVTLYEYISFRNDYFFFAFDFCQFLFYLSAVLYGQFWQVWRLYMSSFIFVLFYFVSFIRSSHHHQYSLSS